MHGAETLADRLRRGFTIALAVTTLLVNGSAWADPTPSGLYASRNGAIKVTFLPGGRAHVGSVGGDGDASYVVDGRTVTVTVNGRAFPLTLVDDDTIAVPDGPTMHRDREYACKDETGDIGHVRLTASGNVQVLDPSNATDSGPHDLGTYTEEGNVIILKDQEGSIVYTREGTTLTSGKIRCERV